MGKLQEQMKIDLSLNGYSPNTTRAYLHCIRNFAKYFMRSPAEMGETEMRKFMLHLAQDRKVSAFTQSTHLDSSLLLWALEKDGNIERWLKKEISGINKK